MRGSSFPYQTTQGNNPRPTAVLASTPQQVEDPQRSRSIGILSGGGPLQAKDRKRKHQEAQSKRAGTGIGGDHAADSSDCEVYSEMADRRRLELRHSFIQLDDEATSCQLQVPNFFEGEPSIVEFQENGQRWDTQQKQGLPSSFSAWKEQKQQASSLSAEELSRLKLKQKQLQQQDEAKQRDVDLRHGIRERWVKVGRLEMPRFRRMLGDARTNNTSNGRKLASMCQKEIRKRLQKNTKSWREVPMRAKRLAREVLVYWRRHDKEQTETKKKAEKEEIERRKREEEIREAKRQQMKLNFLLTQTELYSHFIAKNTTAVGENVPQMVGNRTQELTGIASIDAEFDQTAMEGRAMEAAKRHIMDNQSRVESFDSQKNGYPQLHHPGTKKKAALDNMASQLDTDKVLMEPQSFGEDEIEVTQPKMFKGQLKSYQLKGLKWLANLHEHGINGILADEMGLGKTVQAISLLSYIAEAKNAWGPFLVIAPSSTLHNWQKEIARFAPDFRILPYWGSQKDRKTLRKDFSFKGIYTRDAPFHVVITSYQLLVTDEKYFQRHRYEFMVLDEAQALKSSNSIRWKTLLGFNCRNRLLLTGTPIQNSMAELWALLHFIMPTLFDNHEEFNEWFSKDIENHASSGGSLNEHQLKRLHMIIKPFMLRRVKKDVESEMAEKVEIELSCEMTRRQRYLYKGIRDNISFEDLFETMAAGTSEDKRRSLMNWVMQFRKVCNHPEIFERRDIVSPFQFKDLHNDLTLQEKLENPLDKSVVDVTMMNRNAIRYDIPKLVWHSSWAGSTSLPHTVPVGDQSRCKLLGVTLAIFATAHIHHSIFHDPRPSFSFLKLLGWSAGDMNQICISPLTTQISKALQSRSRIACLSTFLETSTGDLGNCISIRHNRLAETLKRGHGCPLQWVEANCSMLTNLRTAYCPRVSALPINVYSNDSNFQHSYWNALNDAAAKQLFVGTAWPCASLKEQLAAAVAGKLSTFELAAACTEGLEAVELLERRQQSVLATEVRDKVCEAVWSSTQQEGGLLAPLYRMLGSSHIHVPNYGKLVTDSGKLLVMDSLLKDLFAEGHRVLIFCQMTKMMDILEDYLSFRKYSFVRLDGSSNLADRRDMVDDFQSRDDIFCFLLSTRAGGLGINLTAADTVIFYDNDWNPTQDAQAMDRTHRIGQTKQVTVYRLVTKGTVEERILHRAKQKDTIQKTVYSGNLKNENLEPGAQEMVSLLVGDEELEGKLKQQQALAKEREKEKRRKRKASNDTRDESAPGEGVEAAAPKKKAKPEKTTENPTGSA